jgi:hypothetical protein
MPQILYSYDNCEQTKDIYGNQMQNSAFLDASLDRKVSSLRESVERNADWSRDATHMSTRQVVDDIHRSNNHITGDGHRNTTHILGDIDRSTQRIVTDVHDSELSNLIATNKGATDSVLATERANNLFLRESGNNQAALTSMLERNHATSINDAGATREGMERNRGDLRSAIHQAEHCLEDKVRDVGSDVKYFSAKTKSNILDAQHHTSHKIEQGIVENIKQGYKIRESALISSKDEQLQAADYQAKNDLNFCKVDNDLSKLAASHFEKTNYRNLEMERRLENQSNKHFEKTNYRALEMQCSIEKQASENARIAQLDICKLENALSSQASANASAIQLEAYKNKCSLEKQIEECCCELKSVVVSTSKNVQDQISSVDNNRLRDDLDQAKTKALILSLKQDSAPSYPPYPYYPQYGGFSGNGNNYNGGGNNSGGNTTRT